jgi:hypothetical protein
LSPVEKIKYEVLILEPEPGYKKINFWEFN